MRRLFVWVAVAALLSGCALRKKEPPVWVTPENFEKEENPCYPMDEFTGKKCLPIIRVKAY